MHHAMLQTINKYQGRRFAFDIGGDIRGDYIPHMY